MSQLCFGHPKTLAPSCRTYGIQEETHADAFVYIEEEIENGAGGKV
jgi:hypothetical protein